MTLYEWRNVATEAWDDLPAVHDTLVADGVLVPVEPAPIRWCLNHRKETWEGRTTCAGMGGVDLCNVIDALLIIGEETPCKGCGGRGWYEGVEPDPRDQTGMTPMQVQIQCPCKGVGGETP